MIPRIRGKIGQVFESEDPKYNGKWAFEIWLTDIGAGEGASLGEFGPWETESIAKTELKRVVRLVSDVIEKKLTGKVSGKYVDMHTNEVRPWDEN